MTDENRVLPATESDGVESSSKSLTSDPLMNLSNISTAVLKGPTVGQQLRTAREAKGLSASEVAHALKLSVHQVLSLENDDWSSLPGTIVRGFIRNYARLLNLSSEALMDQLDVLRMPPPQLDISSGTSTALPQTSRVERRDLAVMFFGLMLLILALLAYFFVPQDFWQSRLAGLSQSAPPPKLTVSETVSSDSLPPSSASDQVAPLGATASPNIETSLPVLPASPEPVQSANPPSSSVSSLKLSFSRSSWVEIRDRSSQVIFSQLNPAGSEREIEGQPPFALVVGNASGVTVQYKGKSIEMPLRSKEDVARFNIE
jgi:cytoskeleton protein RodZ